MIYPMMRTYIWIDTTWLIFNEEGYLYAPPTLPEKRMPLVIP